MTTTQTKQLNGLNGGRKLTLTKQLATLITESLATSQHSLLRLCSDHPEWPSYGMLDCWRGRKPWFARMLWLARERQADLMAFRTQDVAEDVLDNPGNMARVQAAKLVCENTRWYAGKVLPKLYGDNALAVNVDARTAVVVGDEQLKELRSRLTDARKLVSDVHSDTERALPSSETDQATKLRAE